MKLPEARTGVDLLGQLSADNWQEIAAANLQLGSEKEAGAIGDVERVICASKIEGERIRLVGYGLSEKSNSYDLCAVEGVADLVISLEVNPEERPTPFATYTKEMAALCVRTVQNDTAANYYFPLDQQAIVAGELLPDTSDIPRHIRKLRHYVDKIQEVVEAEGIQDAASKRQLIDELNEALDEIVCGAEVRVDCQAYSRRVGAVEYGVDVDANAQVLFGDVPMFVWRGDRPVLEMFDSQDQSVLFRIDVYDVLDIMPIEQDDEPGTDLFKTIFTDEFQQPAWQLATDLSYTDEECFANTLREHIQTLSDVLPDDYRLDYVKLSGFVLVPSDSGNVWREEFVDSSRAYVDGVSFVEHGEVTCAVLEVVVSDQLGDSLRRVYVMPDRDKLLRFESLYDDVGDLEFAVTSLHDIAQDASEIFDDNAFYELSLRDQIELLQQYDDEAHNILKVINEPREFSGECTVSAYRCLPADLLGVISWNDAPLRETNSSENNEPFTLRADRLAVCNPEFDEIVGLSERILNVSSLPLSHGEPVLIAGNREDNVFYLVCARDVIGLSRAN